MKEPNGVGDLADRLFDGFVEVDSKGRITHWNKAAERITGYTSDQTLGRQLQKQPGRQISEAGLELPDQLVPLLQTMRDGVQREALGYVMHADGYRLRIIIRTMAVLDHRRKISGGRQIFSDNKALIAAFQASQATEETVLFDPLTGIGNRPHIESKIKAAIDDHGHGRDSNPFGILFIDIDHFKDLNDTYGHLIGDKVLRLTANTLRQNLRITDSCGRWGGEEFIALVNGLDAQALERVSEKLRQTIQQAKVKEKDLEIGVTVSIGSTLAKPGDSFQSLVERADQLMYESKRLGRNRVTVG